MEDREHTYTTHEFKDADQGCCVYVRLGREHSGIRFVISSETDGDCDVVLSLSDMKHLAQMLETAARSAGSR